MSDFDTDSDVFFSVVIRKGHADETYSLDISGVAPHGKTGENHDYEISIMRDYSELPGEPDIDMHKDDIVSKFNALGLLSTGEVITSELGRTVKND
jgi:hypothetical protein